MLKSKKKQKQPTNGAVQTAGISKSVNADLLKDQNKTETTCAYKANLTAETENNKNPVSSEAKRELHMPNWEQKYHLFGLQDFKQDYDYNQFLSKTSKNPLQNKCEIAELFLNVFQHDTEKEINFKKLFRKCDFTQVQSSLEQIIICIFDSFNAVGYLSILNESMDRIRSRFSNDYNLKSKLIKNDTSNMTIEFCCEESNLKSNLILKKSKLARNETIFTLLDFIRGYKCSVMYSRLINIDINFRLLDVTKEISDCSSFLIDGYSLIVECFKKVDTNSGGQFLHLIYLIEKYIETFSNLTEFYFIVFFQNINSLFVSHRQFYLAINVVCNHLTSVEKISSKLKFFKSLADPIYKDFLDKEKPTFLIISDKMIISDSIQKKNELIAVYDITYIYHLSSEINLMLINDLSIKSNRLNAFYTEKKGLMFDKHFKILTKLKYEKDLESTDVRNDDWKKFSKNLLKSSEKEIKSIQSKIGSKLTYYCTTLIWCYKMNEKDKQFDEDFFGALLFALIFHCHLQNELDLKQRAIRFLQDGFESTHLAEKNIEIFLERFQEGLALFIESKHFEFLNLLAKESCDIFDGRLLKLCLLVSYSNLTRSSFELNFIKSNQMVINEILLFLRNEFQKLDFNSVNSSFINKIDMGTSEASLEELTDLFKSFFGNDDRLNEKHIENVCFKENEKAFKSEMSSSNHPLHSKLLSEIDCCVNNLENGNKFAEIVENFKNKYSWFDSFRTYKPPVKNEIENDLKFDQMIKDLNVFSFQQNTVQQAKITNLEIKRIKTAFKNFDLLEALDLMRVYQETNESVYEILKWLFETLKKKESQKFEKIAIILLTKADQLWRIILNNKNLEQNTKKDYLILILSILDYFEFDHSKQSVLNYFSIKFDTKLYENEKKHKLSESEKRFQLKYLSDYLKTENTNSNDSRTQMFKPNKWQTEFLDAIDNEESVLITAPTSSGKTYASFYAMEKVIKSKNPHSVLVYVSPTKALVNQTAYAIMQRFENNVNIEKGKQLCGVFTRDFRNSLFDCKILVTVPQCLYILAMNHNHAEWLKNVKYVVFDEIHSMGGEVGTDVWEHLILLINSPIIALSATIANSKMIHDWLTSLNKHRNHAENRKKIRLIEFSERSSDLKKFIYTNTGLKQLHPVGFVDISNVKKHQRLPTDLNLSAAETLELYDSLKAVYSKEESFKSLEIETNIHLNAKLSTSLFITRNEMKKYETQVKTYFQDHILDCSKTKKANQVVKLLEVDFEEDQVYPPMSRVNETCSNSEIKEIHKKCFIDLIEDLIEQKMLPCIIFTNNRILCEKYSRLVADYLEGNKIVFENSLTAENNNSIDSNIIRAKFGQEMSSLLEAGVGWHHSGLDPQLKSLIEAYFRIGKIKIILATATLALGIHMPCKSVVFMDDSIYLDSFQFRQAAGRAGRQGYDTIGNVIFFDIPFSKVKRLVGSYLPEIRPHFPLSITFCLSLFGMAFKKTKETNMSVDCVIKKSFWNFKHPSKVSQVQYDAISGLSFLMDLQLLNSKGKFSIFTDLIERIGYHEPSNFVLYNLFINGVFHELIPTDSNYDSDFFMNQIINILCHIFNQHPLRKKSKNSLPDLPPEVTKSIQDYNSFVLSSYTNFFIGLCQKIKETTKTDINMLPLSKISFSKKTGDDFWSRWIKKWNYQYSLTSPFAGLSGVLDQNVLCSNNELFLNCLSLLHIDSKVLPLFNENSLHLLHNYVYIFFSKEESFLSIIQEIVESGILIGDLLNILKDFNVIIYSIRIFLLRISPTSDKVSQAFEEINIKFNEKFKYLTENLHSLENNETFDYQRVKTF